MFHIFTFIYVQIVVLVIIKWFWGEKIPKICPFDSCPRYSPQEEVLELRYRSKSIGGGVGGTERWWLISFEPLVRVGSFIFQLTMAGVILFYNRNMHTCKRIIVFHKQSLDTGGTVCQPFH